MTEYQDQFYSDIIKVVQQSPIIIPTTDYYTYIRYAIQKIVKELDKLFSEIKSLKEDIKEVQSELESRRRMDIRNMNIGGPTL